MDPILTALMAMDEIPRDYSEYDTWHARSNRPYPFPRRSDDGLRAENRCRGPAPSS